MIQLDMFSLGIGLAIGSLLGLALYFFMSYVDFESKEKEKKMIENMKIAIKEMEERKYGRTKK